MPSHPLSTFVALGDSMTIGDYPSLDAEARYRRRITGVGAAALTFRNNDALFPEFRGRDIVSRAAQIRLVELASDGATLPSVDRQIEKLDKSALIVSLTVGGNDLLHAYYGARNDKQLASDVRAISEHYDSVVQRIRAAAPEAFLLLTTVYDPTDGTGRMPGMTQLLPVRHLHSFNERVRLTAHKIPGSALTDVHAHFLGRGVTAPPSRRWYWSGSIIEPSLEGASEIRRLWIDALFSSAILQLRQR